MNCHPNRLNSLVQGCCYSTDCSVEGRQQTKGYCGAILWGGIPVAGFVMAVACVVPEPFFEVPPAALAGQVQHGERHEELNAREYVQGLPVVVSD